LKPSKRTRHAPELLAAELLAADEVLSSLRRHNSTVIEYLACLHRPLEEEKQEELSLFREGEKELIRAHAWRLQLKMTLDPLRAVALCLNLQLALDHPMINGATRQYAQELIDSIHNWLKHHLLHANAKIVDIADAPTSMTTNPTERPRKSPGSKVQKVPEKVPEAP
jgi:hypothetical protein